MDDNFWKKENDEMKIKIMIWWNNYIECLVYDVESSIYLRFFINKKW